MLSSLQQIERALEMLLSYRDTYLLLSLPSLHAHFFFFFHVYRCFLKHPYREGRREKVSLIANSRKKKKTQHNTKQRCSWKAEVELENSS